MGMHLTLILSGALQILSEMSELTTAFCGILFLRKLLFSFTLCIVFLFRVG
jgi:hypothetical protein